MPDTPDLKSDIPAENDSDQVINTVPFNPELAISGVVDLLKSYPNCFDQARIENHNLYLEKIPNVYIDEDSELQNPRFFATNLTTTFSEVLQVSGRDAIYTLTSTSKVYDIWSLDIQKEEYARTLIRTTADMRRNGQLEAKIVLPKGEIIDIFFVPLDPNGSQGGTGTYIKSFLKGRHK